MSVSCLTVTNRPKWLPWVQHQVSKQKLTWMLSGAKKPEHIVVDGSKFKTIGEAREHALSLATHNWAAWFDDDDWSNPGRLNTGTWWLERGATAVGNLSSWMINAGNLDGICALPYEGYGHLIFNGMVFNVDRMRRGFIASSRGEDVDWVKRSQMLGAHVIVPATLHAWLCHEENIVNPSTRLAFETTLPGVIEITAEERRLLPT